MKAYPTIAMTPDLDDPAWITITAPLLSQLGTPRTIGWIKQWIRANKTKCLDYLNMLAYLSIKGLITSCYDSQEETYWVVICNVPRGWLTYKVTSDAIVRTAKKAPTYETVSMAEPVDA